MEFLYDKYFYIKSNLCIENKHVTERRIYVIKVLEIKKVFTIEDKVFFVW